jgi:RNase H-fold protein (predicted Holliday junction resolvase)
MRLFIGLLISVAVGLASLTPTGARSCLVPAVDLSAGSTWLTQNEKASRTAAQKKIDSQLLYALKQKRGETDGVPTEPIHLDLDQKERALLDISANVTPQVESQIKKLGGSIVSSDERFHTMRARLALEKLEALAALKDVRFIAPAAMPVFNRISPN